MIDGERTRYHSLRVKITAGLLLSVIVALVITSWLRYVSFRSLLVESLTPFADDVESLVAAQLAAYLRSRFVLSVGTIVAILIISDLMLSRMVTGRLKQFLKVIKQVQPGHMDAKVTVSGRDEITELAHAFNRMAEDLREQAQQLSTFNTLASAVGQSLNLREVMDTALRETLALTRLQAGWITLRRGDGEELWLAASRGLTEETVGVHRQCNWKQCLCSPVFESGRSQVFQDDQQRPCPAAIRLQREGLIFRACTPLQAREHVLGVMSLVGVPERNRSTFSEDSLRMLTAVGREVGVAIENASLYEELRETEMLRRRLLERGYELQEEERRRIARELHDQTSQQLTSILMTLKVLGEARSLPEVQARVEELREMAAQTLEEVHDLALALRPRLLDDLGLLAALQHYLGEFRGRSHLPVDFQVLGLENRRLSSRAETALYRIAQEALTNVMRHAQAQNVGVLLEARDTSIILIIEDDGRGFDVSRAMGSHVHEGNLGLYGMRERAALVGGTLTIESVPGEGTSVFAQIPLNSRRNNCGQDPHPDC
jgi:signal transduction histidine kinase